MNGGSLLAKVNPDAEQIKELIVCDISLKSRPEDALKHSAIYFVIRPYDYNGLSAINRMEYRENCLFVNKTRILIFRKRA